MKTIIVALIILIQVNAYAQIKFESDYLGDTEKYLKDEVASDFKSIFDTDQKKRDFKELREYLSGKENLLQALNRRQIGLQRNVYSSDTVELSRYSDQLKKTIKGKGQNALIEVPYIFLQKYRSEVEFTDEYLETFKVNPDYLNKVLDYYEQQILFVRESAKQRKTLDINIRNIRQDVYDCRNEIDSALAPEYKQQEFRVTISICFAALIGILLIVFFFIVFKRSDSTLSKELLSGNGLQFVTLFVLIIAIVLFGILNILQGSELAAILSGISGYILGKGTQVDTRS